MYMKSTVDRGAVFAVCDVRGCWNKTERMNNRASVKAHVDRKGWKQNRKGTKRWIGEDVVVKHICDKCAARGVTFVDMRPRNDDV